jgi:YVTN family beta-propeller protein
VVNKSDDSVSIIDTKTKQIVSTLPTGKGPHELVATDDGKFAVSTDFVGGDSLTVFDVAKQQVLRTIDLENYPGPHGISFLPASLMDVSASSTEKEKAQQRVIFTSGKSAHVVIANIFTGEIEAAIPTKQQTTHMLALSPSEDLVYATNIRSNTISKIALGDDFDESKVLKQISVEAMPEAIKLLNNGSELWYGANKDGLVTVLDTNNEAVLAQFDGFSFPYRVLFSHDESIAMVPDFRNHDIRFFDVKMKQELGRLKLEKEAGPQGITMHSEFDIAFLSLNLKNKVVAIDIHSRKIIAEYPTGNNPDGVVFIPR